MDHRVCAGAARGAIRPPLFRPNTRRGHAVVEVALLAPWMLLLFAGLFDFGMYCSALITVENAARTAALHTSISSDAADDAVLACSVVLQHIKALSNTNNLQNCDTLPVQVAVASATDSEGFLTSRVSVAYQTPQYFPLPFMTGRMTINRTAEMRVKP